MRPYDNPPGTVVTPLQHGYELVKRPGRAQIVRKTLSRAGKIRRERKQALRELGYEVNNYATHPGRPSRVMSIASAARLEGLK